MAAGQLHGLCSAQVGSPCLATGLHPIAITAVCSHMRTGLRRARCVDAPPSLPACRRDAQPRVELLLRRRMLLWFRPVARLPRHRAYARRLLMLLLLLLTVLQAGCALPAGCRKGGGEVHPGLGRQGVRDVLRQEHAHDAVQHGGRPLPWHVAPVPQHPPARPNTQLRLMPWGVG